MITIVTIVAFGVVIAAVMLANLFLYMMIGEINRKRAESELVSVSDGDVDLRRLLFHLPPMTSMAAVISMLMGLTSATAVNVFMLMMIGKVNREVAAADRLRFIGVTPPELVRIFREYRRLFPAGRLHLYAVGAMGAAVLSFLFLIVSVEAM